MLRQAMEALTRNWRYTRCLRFAGQQLPIEVSPSNGLRYLLKPMKSIDPLLLELASQYVKPGAVVWDVGANTGLFSFASAALAGPTGLVAGFEADEYLVGALRRSASKQPQSSAPVRIVGAAVAERCGKRHFSIARRARASNHLVEYGRSQTGGSRETREVEAISLDSALELFPPPDVLKLDIEGAEIEALRGAGKVLSSRPIIIFEPDANSIPFLRAAGYEVRFVGNEGVGIPAMHPA